MGMLNFELISTEALTQLSDHPREIAKDRVSEYRARSVKQSAANLPHVPDVPPEFSIRRVFYAASTGQKRSVWQRIKTLFGRLT